MVMIPAETIRMAEQEACDRADEHKRTLARKQAEIDSLRGALKAIAGDIKPQLCDSELELIVWWGRQVDRLQAIARAELDQGGAAE